MQTAFWRTSGRLLLLAAVRFGFARTLAAEQVSSQALVYAVYQGRASAGDVLQSIRQAQPATAEQIESYAVLSQSLEGKTTVPEACTRGIPSEMLTNVKASLTPGTSALILVLEDPWIAETGASRRSPEAAI